jgi:hypothetical protein
LGKGGVDEGDGNAAALLSRVRQQIAHGVHDPNAIDAVRFTVSVPFAAAGLSARRRRSDSHFP